MKKFRTVLVGMLLLAMIGCQNQAKKSSDESDQGKEVNKEAEAKPKIKKLTPEEEAINLMKNTLGIFSGSLALAYNNAFQQSASSLAQAFSSGSVETIDSEIAKIDEELIKQLNEMGNEMDKAFDKMKLADKAAYSKLFKHEVFKQGIEISKEHKLPKGFPPLSQNLNSDELKRYIVKISTASEDEGDPVIAMYTELMQWFQKADEELKKDPEIVALMKKMNE